MRTLEERTFLLLTIIVTLAFGWVLWPFFGAILWGAVVAILFAPLNRWLVMVRGYKPNLAALITISIVVLIVILPLVLITIALIQEAAVLFSEIQSGSFNFNRYFQQVADALPIWAKNFLNRSGLYNFSTVQDKIAVTLTEASQYLATQIVGIGQTTAQFFVSLGVMLYLAFFLIRDGDKLFLNVKKAIPLHQAHKRALFTKFTTVVRATVKGDILVASLQGALGGFIFWVLGLHAPLLWAVLMMFMSLLPAIGAGLVWLPVAIYFFATGAIWEGVVLTLFGTFVIGLVDNILRPALVSKDTKMPDYVVLISTLGGIGIFGLNGFVVGPVIAAMFIAVWDIFPSSQTSQDSDTVA